MRAHLNINLLTSNDQFCVCNLDEYFLKPVLKEHKDPKKQMEYALTGFLEYHKKQPFKDRKPNDEITYYTGEVYQKIHLTIYDIKWNINVPHSEEMEDEILDEIFDKFIEPLTKLLDEMNIDFQFMA